MTTRACGRIAKLRTGIAAAEAPPRGAPAQDMRKSLLLVETQRPSCESLWFVSHDLRRGRLSSGARFVR